MGDAKEKCCFVYYSSPRQGSPCVCRAPFHALHYSHIKLNLRIGIYYFYFSTLRLIFVYVGVHIYPVSTDKLQQLLHHLMIPPQQRMEIRKRREDSEAKAKTSFIKQRKLTWLVTINSKAILEIRRRKSGKVRRGRRQLHPNPLPHHFLTLSKAL